MRHLKKKIKSFNTYTSKEQFQSKTFMSNKLGALPDRQSKTCSTLP